MSTPLATVMLLLFLAHLGGFAWRGAKRREWYYLAPVVTFFLLSSSFALLLSAPEWTLGEKPVYSWVRYAAWASAVISISWGAARFLERRRSGTTARTRRPGR